jgi:uncharacterized membrane protein YdjX (TVP38/TMEM64 family)
VIGTDQVTGRTMSRKIKRLLLAVISLASLYLIVRVSGVGDHLDADQIAERMRASGTTGIGLFIAAFSLGSLTQVPGTVFLVAALAVYGGVRGAIVGTIGAIVACTFSFLVVRITGRWILESKSLAVFAKYAPYIERQPIRAIVFLRLIFGASPPVNWALALSAVRTREFLVGTVLGIVPNLAVYIWLIHELAFDEQPDLPRWAVVVLLATVVGVSVVAHRRMMRSVA